MKYKKLFYRDVMPASLIIFQSTSVSYFIAIFLTMSPIVNFSRTLTPLFPDIFMLSEFLIRLQNQTSSPNSKARSGGHFIVKTTLSFSTLTIIESNVHQSSLSLNISKYSQILSNFSLLIISYPLSQIICPKLLFIFSLPFRKH